MSDAKLRALEMVTILVVLLLLPSPPAEHDVHLYRYQITGYATARDQRAAIRLAVEHAHSLDVTSVEIKVEEIE